MLLVVALGGNALLRRGESSISAQFRNAEKAMAQLTPLLRTHHVVLTHGNGPQVGSILIRSEAALGKTYTLPLAACVAESQGEIGYVIEQSLLNALRAARINRPVAAMLTHVVVDANDPAFTKPTKPIGPFYTKAQAAKLKRKGMVIANVGNGYRRVVASPRPVEIIEAPTIRDLARTTIVTAAGGGGIPVVRRRGKLEGIDAVIDKDRASSLLARQIKADLLLILTDVPGAYLNFRKKNQKLLRRLTAADAERYLRDGHFAEGSMGPKVEAAIAFIKTGGRKVIITSPSVVQRALCGTAGTMMVK